MLVWKHGHITLCSYIMNVELGKHYAKWTKPDTERKKKNRDDLTYMRNLKNKSNAQKEQGRRWLPESGGGGKEAIFGKGYKVAVMSRWV